MPENKEAEQMFKELASQNAELKAPFDAAARMLGAMCDHNKVGMVAGWLAYLAEAIEDEIGEGWLYDLETLIRERRERGSW